MLNGRTIIVELSGPPQGKGRPRFLRKSGTAYTPAKTRSYEESLGWAAREAMRGHAPFEDAVSVVIIASCAIPKSFSRSKRAAALLGALRPTVKPDADNLAKCMDALNKIVWRDDAQAVEVRITKRYSDKPSLRFEVTRA